MKVRLIEALDSKGNELSPEQEVFFKRSKIRNDFGELLVVYRGTVSQNERNYFSGNAKWFTSNKDYADKYNVGENKTTYECYLNCTNVFDCGNTDGRLFNLNPTKLSLTNDFLAILHRLNLTEQLFVKKFEQELKDKSSYTWHIYTVVRTDKFIDLVRRSGYDCIHTIEEGDNDCYGVLYNRCIKLTSNLDPTNSDNINEGLQKDRQMNIVKEVEKHFGTLDEPYYGKTYIMPDGKFLDMRNVEHHADIEKWLIDKGLSDKEYIGTGGSQTMRELGAIRCDNTRYYMELPPIDPTQEQYTALLYWLDLHLSKTRVIEVVTQDGKQVMYRKEENVADDIVDKIRRYYIMGVLLESKDKIVRSKGWTYDRLPIGSKIVELTEDVERMPADFKPEKIGKAYKVFYEKNGKLYPPMVANKGGSDTPIGVWLKAQVADMGKPSKTGRPQVQGGGKGTKSGKLSLAFRPGWHLGDIPLAKQFLKKDGTWPKDLVWAECDYAMDIDYQDEANERGYWRTKVDDEGNVSEYRSDKYQHSLAGLKKIPENGYYKYRTNPNPDTVPWVITGAMKVNRILSNDEVEEILKKAGIQAPKIEESLNESSKETVKDKNNRDFNIWTEVNDYHDGQYDCMKIAYTGDNWIDNNDNIIKDNLLGYIDYSVYDNVAYINFIKVKDTERRKGIASELIKSLQKEYKNINWGFTTEDGTALRKSLDETLRRVKKDIYATYNVNDVIDLLKDTDHDWRLMYDDHEKLWLLGDANGVIHFDMLESAWDQGYFDDNMDWIYEYVGADTDSYRDIAEDGFYLNEDEPNEEWVDPWLYSLLYVVDNDDSFYQQDGFVHNAMTTLGGRLYARDNYSLEETPLSSICI